MVRMSPSAYRVWWSGQKGASYERTDKLEMAARVRDFLRAHPTEGAGDGAALARLEELQKRAEALAAQQRAGVLATRAATAQLEATRRSLTRI